MSPILSSTSLEKKVLLRRGVKLQVSLPTPVNTIAVVVKQPYHKEAESIYEVALMKALRRIKDNTLAEDLAIQWDLAIDVFMPETATLAAPF